jgi:hypothetical protein
MAKGKLSQICNKSFTSLQNFQKIIHFDSESLLASCNSFISCCGEFPCQCSLRYLMKKKNKARDKKGISSIQISGCSIALSIDRETHHGNKKKLPRTLNLKWA